MLSIEPSLRCTLADLLRGGDLDQLCEARKDEWLPEIETCIHGTIPSDRIDAHGHIKITSAEVKVKGRR